MSQPARGAAAITCRHLLVPVDETDASTATVIAAIELAQMVGARITFVHAQHALAAGRHGAAVSVAAMANSGASRTRELLTKAESVARAYGVPCGSASTLKRVGCAALLEAASDARCDLIFIGRHERDGELGAIPGSLVSTVLGQAHIPVFVLPVQAPTQHPIRVIRDAHRAVTAMLHAWLELLKQAESDGVTADIPLMRAMARFLKAFLVEFHHPREEALLFSRLRQRTSRVGAELDELERQHERDAQLVTMLAEAIDRYAIGGSVAELAQELDKYSQFIWELMGREEGVMLPAAQRYLTDWDWDEINATFCSAEDAESAHSGEGSDRPFAALLTYLADAPDADCMVRACERLRSSTKPF
ncbi:hemerythrin domain-containing protein [Cupriavidus sp. CP313]